MEVEFRDLSYEVSTYFRLGDKKTILKDVSGKFLPGQLCGILGTSGAGKTTLLHALSGYRTRGVSGKLLVDGATRNETWFRQISCYLTQEDQLPSFVTVQEAMVMAAQLRMPRMQSIEVKTQTVIAILSHLGLEDTQDTFVHLLSGGQRRRLSLALELLDNPPVFFLDEPTSGLDDVAAKHTAQLLRRLATEGRTVVATVHQPSASLLRLFHRIFVVADGQCVFQGTPGALVPFLDAVGFACPTSYNPADYIIELVDGNPENVQILCRAIQNGKLSQDVSKDSEYLSQLPSVDTISKELATQDCQWMKLSATSDNSTVPFTNPSWFQFWILLQRFFGQILRNKNSLIIQTCHYVGCAVLLGLTYYDSANDGAMIFHQLKFLVAIIVFYGYTRIFIPIILFPNEIKMTKKEHFNRWYGLGPYYMATTLAHIPLQVLFNILFITIVYYLVGLPNDLWLYFMYVLIGNMLALASEGLGYVIGSTFNAMNALIIAPSISVSFLCLAIYGFDFAKKIPLGMKYFMAISPMRCAISSLSIVSFGFNRKPLRCEEELCLYTSPRKFLEFLDGKDNDLYREISILLFLLLFYRVVAYFGLRRRFIT